MGWFIPGDRAFTAFPLFHTSGQVIAFMGALVNDGSICVEREFSASQFMPRAREEKATMLFGVGPMGMAILAQPPTPSDGEHRFRLAIWIPMSPEQQAEFERRFNTTVTQEVYGHTECMPVTISSVNGRRNPATAGLPSPYLEVRIVDDFDNELPPGQAGEVVARPRHPELMYAGYWGNPEATLAASRNLWHHTGDLARADEDGFITFVDRKKDALRRRGEMSPHSSSRRPLARTFQ